MLYGFKAYLFSGFVLTEAIVVTAVSIIHPTR